MRPPLASIVVPVFNAEEFLFACIGSLVDQTYDRLEIIIVDDGSTDESIRSIDTFRADPRLRVISQENSGGPASPRNRGAAEATGEFVFFFDADDIAKPEKVETTIRLLEQDKAGRSFVATDFEILDQATGNVVDKHYLRNFGHIGDRFNSGKSSSHLSLDPRDAYEALLPGNFIGTSSVAARKAALIEVGGFDVSLRNGDDYEMWLRLARHGGMLITGDVLHTYRRRSESISRRNTLKLAPNRVTVLKKQLSYSLPARQRKIVNSRIAANYSAMGWEARDSGKYSLALRCYSNALLRSIRWTYVRGLLAAVLAATMRRSAQHQ